MVIRRMALDLAIRTEVIACPTVREPDGLALSSRNVHLDAERAGRGRRSLHRALVAARDALGGRRTIRRRAAGGDARDPRRRSRSPSVDYVSVADADDARRARPGRRAGARSRWRSASGRRASSTTSCWTDVR